jgi:hypothetical protein
MRQRKLTEQKKKNASGDQESQTVEGTRAEEGETATPTEPPLKRLKSTIALECPKDRDASGVSNLHDLV